MSTERPALLDTSAINQYLQELYTVVVELMALTKIWEELSAGPRNANDAWAIDAINIRIRALRKERAAIRKAIHELPQPVVKPS